MNKTERITVQNVYTELSSIERQLRGVVNDKISHSLQEQINNLYAMIRDPQVIATEMEEDDNYERFEIIQRELNIDTIMALYVANKALRVELLDSVPFAGKLVKSLKYESETVPVCNTMTYKEFWIAADKVRRLANDHSHVFLERFNLDETTGVIQVTFGS